MPTGFEQHLDGLFVPLPRGLLYVVCLLGWVGPRAASASAARAWAARRQPPRVDS